MIESAVNLWVIWIILRVVQSIGVSPNSQVPFREHSKVPSPRAWIFEFFGGRSLRICFRQSCETLGVCVSTLAGPPVLCMPKLAVPLAYDVPEDTNLRPYAGNDSPRRENAMRVRETSISINCSFLTASSKDRRRGSLETGWARGY